MTKPTWPFKKCATPREFLDALRKALPCKFRVWKASWFVSEGQLRVSIEYSPRVRGKHTNLGLVDILSFGWCRRDAQSVLIRKFPGFAHLDHCNGEHRSCSFSVELAHLPRIAKLAQLRDQLLQQERDAVQKDADLLDLRKQVDALRVCVGKRSDLLLRVHKKAHAADYANVRELEQTR